MSVRAKFKCISVTESIGSVPTQREDGKPGWGPGTVWNYRFAPVTGDTSEENKTFWYATPSGQIELGVVKSDLFKIGEEYYIDFTPATEA